MTAGEGRRTAGTLFGFVLALVLAALCYRPAIYGDFTLDDRSNLDGLAAVADGAPALDFVLSGEAGPTGRPLALATFALQADQWADGPAAFLAVNILIHLANAVLLLGCCYLLARQSGTDRTRAVTAAAAAAAVWVLLPLNATTTLLVVQRMTGLSALFVLAGLGAYLLARARIETRPVAALAGMTASLGAGTALAMLCKESGLLLPVFALVLESTLLDRPRSMEPRKWRLWQAAVLFLPLAAILYYLATLLQYPEGLELRRGFGPLERLATEMRVLWLYVSKALVGLPGRLGIYQTPPGLSRSFLEPLTLLATTAWVALGTAALVLRRRLPRFSLAVLWFLAAHLIESTVVPLEIYFEHRNYLALTMPVFAIAGAVAAGPAMVRRAGAGLLAVVIIANAFFLYTFASIWGEPSASSRYWAIRYPDSPRAVTTMARYQLVEEGPLPALRTIDRFALDHPGSAYLRIQELNLRCLVMPGEDHRVVLRQLDADLPRVDFTYTAGRMLSELLDTVAAGNCNGIDTGTVAAIAERLLDNPRYAADRLYNRFHHKLMAAVAQREGDGQAALAELRKAMTFGRSSELNVMMTTALVNVGDFDAALDFIEDARRRGPRNLVRRMRWQRDLDLLEAYVLEVREQAATDTGRPADADEESEAP